MAERPSTLERLMRDTETLPNGCIVYTRYRDKQGYARIWVPEVGEKQLIHRVAYEIFIGPIPEGYEVDHLCFTRHCVNPQHLEAVTPLVNTRRALRGNARKTHCDHGHEFTPQNTRLDPRSGKRMCRACDAERKRAAYARDSERIKKNNRAWWDRNKDERNARRRAAWAGR